MPTSFRSRTRHIVATALLLLTPAMASAQDFSFFGNFDQGPNAGIIRGTLTLAGYTAGATGTFSASSLRITQYPDAIIPSPDGNEATLWSLQTANSFSLNAGLVTGWQFIAGTGAQYDINSYLLCFNTRPFVGLPGNRVCPQNLNFVGLGGNEEFAFNFGGAQGLTFTPTSTVPEPGSVAMLLIGLVSIGAVSVRRRRPHA